MPIYLLVFIKLERVSGVGDLCHRGARLLCTRVGILHKQASPRKKGKDKRRPVLYISIILFGRALADTSAEYIPWAKPTEYRSEDIHNQHI